MPFLVCHWLLPAFWTLETFLKCSSLQTCHLSVFSWCYSEQYFLTTLEFIRRRGRIKFLVNFMMHIWKIENELILYKITILKSSWLIEILEGENNFCRSMTVNWRRQHLVFMLITKVFLVTSRWKTLIWMLCFHTVIIIPHYLFFNMRKTTLTFYIYDICKYI